MEKKGGEKGEKRVEKNGRECGDYYFIIRASHQGVSAIPQPADDDYEGNEVDGG